MSILVYATTQDHKISASALETVSYAVALANKTKEKVYALSYRAKDAEVLGDYGVSKVFLIDNIDLQGGDTQYLSSVIKELSEKEQIDTIIFDSSYSSKTIAPYLSAELDAEYISNVVSVPESLSPFQVERSCFSGRVRSKIEINAKRKILQIVRNSVDLKTSKTNIEIISYQPTTAFLSTNIVNTEFTTGRVSITDAQVVVSGGRGLKGPEHWGMVEELAALLHGATACSKPVSDQGWRPHSEHVGQTGKTISSNLYIAIGISGSIQHLAGVIAAKTKIVINNDPEAPFFKNADYGILGDAFEIVPKLIKLLKTI